MAATMAYSKPSPLAKYIDNHGALMDGWFDAFAKTPISCRLLPDLPDNPLGPHHNSANTHAAPSQETSAACEMQCKRTKRGEAPLNCVVIPYEVVEKVIKGSAQQQHASPAKNVQGAKEAHVVLSRFNIPDAASIYIRCERGVKLVTNSASGDLKLVHEPPTERNQVFVCVKCVPRDPKVTKHKTVSASEIRNTTVQGRTRSFVYFMSSKNKEAMLYDSARYYVTIQVYDSAPLEFETCFLNPELKCKFKGAPNSLRVVEIKID